jgi:hypothetical protein
VLADRHAVEWLWAVVELLRASAVYEERTRLGVQLTRTVQP